MAPAFAAAPKLVPLLWKFRNICALGTAVSGFLAYELAREYPSPPRHMEVIDAEVVEEPDASGG